MTKKIVLTGGLAAIVFLTGCYNTPQTSLRKPGEGPSYPHAGPAVGPGTVAGGSTAGPQPKPVAHKAEEGHGTPGSVDAKHPDASHSADTTPAHGAGDHATKPPVADTNPPHPPKH